MEEVRKGQPPKIEKPGVRDRLLIALSKGATYHIACGYAGMSYEQLREWRRRGRALLKLTDEEREVHKDKIYYDLLCDMQKCEAVAACRWLEKIDDASSIHWQAAAWKLERRYPKFYGKDKSLESKVDNNNEDIKRIKDKLNDMQKNNDA